MFPYSQHGFISVYYARGKAAATPQLFAGFLVVPMGCVVAALDLHLRCAQAKWEVLQLIWRLWKWILGCDKFVSNIFFLIYLIYASKESR